jgi:hypothetical protein
LNVHIHSLTWLDFDKIHLCVGTVLSLEDLANARKPAYVLTIDFGPHGVNRSSAQIAKHYTKDELVGWAGPLRPRSWISVERTRQPLRQGALFRPRYHAGVWSVSPRGGWIRFAGPLKTPCGAEGRSFSAAPILSIEPTNTNDHGRGSILCEVQGEA